MTTKVVQLTNKAGENIYPVVLDDGKATIEVTDTDPGEGVALQENHFIAVYGDAAIIQTDDIASGAVTSDKIDWTTLGGRVAYGDIAVGTSVSTGSFFQLNFSTRRVFNANFASTPTSGAITLQPGCYIVYYGGRISDGSAGNRWFAGLWDTSTSTSSDGYGYWYYSNLRYAWTGVIYINISSTKTFKPSFYFQDSSGSIKQTAWYLFCRLGDTIA